MLTTKIALAAAVVLAVGLGACDSIHAQVSAVRFLQEVNSARAAGVGNCVATMVSEESAYYNPASLGLLHMDKAFSFVAPHNTTWIPEMTDDFHLKSWSASAGVSTRRLKKSNQGETNLSFGLAYSSTRLNYRSLERTGESGEVISVFQPYDAAHCLSVGFGYERKVRIGIGYAIKFVDSRYEYSGAGVEQGEGTSDGTGHQIGVMASLPLNEPTADDRLSAGTSVEITPTVAYVLDNLGSGMFRNGVSDDFPKLSRGGLSVLVAFTRDGREFGSLRGSAEMEKLHIEDAESQMKFGLEVGALKALFLRFGSFESEGSRKALATFGAGLRLRPLFDGRARGDGGDSTDDRGFGDYLKRHLDVGVDYARYATGVESNYSKTWFYAISLSI